MGKIKTDQKGFSVVEILLALIFIALVVLIGVYVAHNHSHKTRDITTTTASDKNAKTNVTAPSNQASPNSPQTQYLKIPELGIELPLGTNVSDLTYNTVQDANGNPSKSIVYMDSSSKLNALFNQIDPDCGNTSQQTSVYGKILTTTSPGANQQADATATINGTTYYLYSKGGFAACGTGTFSPTAAQQAQINAYISGVETAVTNAQAL